MLPFWFHSLRPKSCTPSSPDFECCFDLPLKVLFNLALDQQVIERFSFFWQLKYLSKFDKTPASDTHCNESNWLNWLISGFHTQFCCLRTYHSSLTMNWIYTSHLQWTKILIAIATTGYAWSRALIELVPLTIHTGSRVCHDAARHQIYNG